MTLDHEMQQKDNRYAKLDASRLFPWHNEAAILRTQDALATKEKSMGMIWAH